MKRNFSLKILFVSLILTVIIVISGGTSLLMRKFLVDSFVFFTYKNLKNTTSLIVRDIKKLMLSNHSKDLHTFIRDAENSIKNVKIQLFDFKKYSKKLNEGAYFNASKGILKGIYVVNRAPECAKCHTNNPIAFLSISLYNPGFSRYVKHINIFIAVFTLLMITGIFILTYIIFNKYIDTEMRSVLSTLDNVNRGNFSSRIAPEIRKSREFTILSKNINQTLSRLQRFIEEKEKEFLLQIQRADRLATVGELSSAIAHEIKNPLAGIRGAVQVIMDSEDLGGDLKKIFEEILRQIDRVTKTLKDLLSLSKDVTPQFNDVYLHKIIDGLFTLLKQQTEKNNITVKKNYDPDVNYIMADQEQLQQVFLNLILNAIQSMPSGGRLTVETKYLPFEKEKIKVKISDTGCGMSEEIVDRIFEPFFTTKPQGTGLGLYTTKRIIDLHGGTISVESQVGKGSTFTVILPVHR